VLQSVTTFRNSCVEHVRPRSRELREASNGRRSRLRIRHPWTDSAHGQTWMRKVREVREVRKVREVRRVRRERFSRLRTNQQCAGSC